MSTDALSKDDGGNLTDGVGLHNFFIEYEK
jgi:hypothetical protein